MTLQPIHSDAGASFAYYGKREGWLVALSVHRDSDALDRSNWSTIVPAMLADHPDDAAIERMSSWLVGWIDYLLVRPGTAAAAEAERWAARLADYPVADDAAYSDLEYAEEWCQRCDRGTREDHEQASFADRSLCYRFRSADEADEITYRWRHRR